MSTIYHYNPVSGIYSGESVADESPLEEGVFLIPAHATTSPPPEVNMGEYAAWTGDEWEVRQIPVETPEPVSLDAAKAAKAAEIEAARDAACLADVVANGRTWQADKRSQDLLGSAITLAIAGLPLPAAWRDRDNSNMPITALADLLAIAGAIAANVSAAYTHSWELKAAVADAQTVEEVAAIDW